MLSEIIYIKDTESMVFNKVENLKLNKDLKLTLIGDKIKPEEQELGNDVKAVTMHKFELKKTKTGFKATIIVDI